MKHAEGHPDQRESSHCGMCGRAGVQLPRQNFHLRHYVPMTLPPCVITPLRLDVVVRGNERPADDGQQYRARGDEQRGDHGCLLLIPL